MRETPLGIERVVQIEGMSLRPEPGGGHMPVVLRGKGASCLGALMLLMLCPQASELLRELCMKNMVWKYCRSISPEWKQQVWRAKRQVWTGHGAVAPLGECQPGGASYS